MRPVPDNLLLDPSKYTNLPSKKGYLFSMILSKWVAEHREVRFADVDGRLYIEISDPVSEMSFSAL